MSFLSSYADSLLKLGLEDPSSREFVERPDLRTIAAFFLGWTFIACLRYLALASLRHPFTGYLVRAALRRPIIITLAERRLASTNEGNNTVQSWLHSTFESSPPSSSDRPEGTRHLSVVLTAAFTITVLMQFLSLLGYTSANQDVLCIIVVAWAGISMSVAKVACLLRITFDLQRLGTSAFERVASWLVVCLSFGAALAHVTLSIGATRDVPEIPGLSLCYRRHFLLTSLIISLLNILLELYFMARTFLLLVPEFLQFHHKVEMMIDVRVARVASILCLDLLTLLPASMSLNIAAEFIPFSLGTLLVLAAFNHHPAKAVEADRPPTSISHRASAITFPTNNGRDSESVITMDEPQVKLVKSTLVPAQQLVRKESLASESARKRSLHKSRDMSRASHISYDSEAEARSVHGAVVSLAFKSDELEPMPALPYGIYQPKLVGSPKFVPRASQVQPPGTASDSGVGVNARALPSPLASSLRKPLGSPSESKTLPRPKPSPSATRLADTNQYAQRAISPAGESVVYGSDVIRRDTPQRPEAARRESGSTMKSHLTSSAMSHACDGDPNLRHFSMSSQSIMFETHDYLSTSPRPTGLLRIPTLGTPQPARSLSARGSAVGRQPSTSGSTSRDPSRGPSPLPATSLSARGSAVGRQPSTSGSTSRGPSPLPARSSPYRI